MNNMEAALVKAIAEAFDQIDAEGGTTNEIKARIALQMVRMFLGGD